jgi:L-amino acid N-acyltransferase YncA
MPSFSNPHAASLVGLHCRALRAGDAPALHALYNNLTPLARRLRFGAAWQPSLERVRQWSEPRVGTESLAVVSVESMPDDGAGRLCAEARFVVSDSGRDSAEFALVVCDTWQRRGLGAWLIDGLMSRARALGLGRLYGLIERDNTAMMGLATYCGLVLHPCSDDAQRLRADGCVAPHRATGALA